MDKGLIREIENLSKEDFLNVLADIGLRLDLKVLGDEEDSEEYFLSAEFDAPLSDEEVEEAHELIRLYCEKDFEAFCDLFFPHYTEHPFNKFHSDSFKFYKKHKRGIRRVDCAPRGYAKSTVKVLFKPLHDICYSLEKYLLFVSATQSQSTEKLKDIRSEILNNSFLADVYGIHFSRSVVGSQAFEVHTEDDTLYLRSVSARTEVRGLRYREHRPSKIILDDVEDSEEVLNEELREKTWAWFTEVISKLGTKRTNIEIVGTVLHRDSLLKKLLRNPAYTGTIYKAVDKWADRKDLWNTWKEIYSDLENDNRLADSDAFYKDHEKEMLKGTSILWAEKESYLDLMKEVVETGLRAFMKEKQNQPMPSDEALFDTIWWYKEDKEDGVDGIRIEKSNVFIPYTDLEAYGAIDPATGESKSKKNTKLDFTSIVAGYQDLKGRLFVHRDWTKRARPSVYIPQIFEIDEEMNFNKFVVEENLYRGLLSENLVREKKKREQERKKRGVKSWGIKVPFYGIENREKKEKRIFQLEPKVNNGWILFHRDLSHEFMEQLQHFPSKEVHDDGPDGLEMLWGAITSKYKAEPINLSVMGSK